MKNTFGNNISVTVFGESHGPAIGCVLDGLPAGIEIDMDYIDHFLTLRRPAGKISTARVEKDPVKFLSGVYQGKTTGTAITIVIENGDTHSADYDDMKNIARPGHADYTAYAKYGESRDARGGGHFSGRITAAVVAAGAIIRYALEKKGIKIGSHIKELHGAYDREFDDISSDIDALNGKVFAVLDDSKEEKMVREIEKAKAEGDSVGGIIEGAIAGLPAGVGEPWFDSLESMMAHALFAVPAVKGVEFGAGFAFADMYGSEANDAFRIEDGKVVTETNNNGGINGGISNGMPVVFRCAVKPTPTIFKEQNTVDFEKMENTTISPRGRHDPSIVHRARVVIDSVVAIAVADLLAQRYGYEYLR